MGVVYQDMVFEEEKKYWTAFLAVNGVGRKTFFSVKYLLKKHELSWADFWNKPALILKKISNKKAVESIELFKKEHNPFTYDEMLKEKSISVVSYKDFEYPQLLAEIADPPPILFVKNGPLPSLKFPISFVGTRKMTRYGAIAIEKLIKEIVHSSPEIISGGMFGVDLESHRVALHNGLPSVAVLGYGFDFWYPRSYSRTFDALLSQGLVCISEFPPHTLPKAGNFPQRNRIVAGMSLGVVVIEAAKKSGSHITAQFALDEGRSVMAVPGPITSLYSEGTKWLCNQGASVVSNGGDILNELGLAAQIDTRETHALSVAKTTQHLSEEQKKLLELLQNGPMLFDALAMYSGLPSTRLAQQLSYLELAGFVLIVADEVSLCL